MGFTEGEVGANDTEGSDVGFIENVGFIEILGSDVGLRDGILLGEVGIYVGYTLGVLVGFAVGYIEGDTEGMVDGLYVGI